MMSESPDSGIKIFDPSWSPDGVSVLISLPIAMPLVQSGPQGATGAQGAVGPQGAQGAQGPKGGL